MSIKRTAITYPVRHVYRGGDGMSIERGDGPPRVTVEDVPDPAPAEQHAPEHVTDEDLASIFAEEDDTPSTAENIAVTWCRADDASEGDLVLAIEAALSKERDRTLRLAAELRALRAPVDVGATLRAAIDRVLDAPGDSILSHHIYDAFKPEIERAAVLARECAEWREQDERRRRTIVLLQEERDVLAREAEGLRATVERKERERKALAEQAAAYNSQRAAMASELDAAHAEIEDLHEAQHIAAESAASQIREARAEIERQRVAIGHLQRDRDTATRLHQEAAAEIERLKAISDAWKALAKAERADSGAARFGTDEDRNRAFAAVQGAHDALRLLGIDPDRD